MENERKLESVILPNGAQIYIEATDDSNSGRELVSSGSVFELSSLKEQIEGIAMFINESIEPLLPTKVGAKFSVEIGISEGHLIGIFAKASTKGNIEISLEWDKAK